MTLDEPIPHLCTVQDICRLLQMSPATFYAKLRDKRFPFAEVEPRIAGPRFRGADVRLYVDGFYAESRVGPSVEQGARVVVRGRETVHRLIAQPFQGGPGSSHAVNGVGEVLDRESELKFVKA
jgi:hypothetical protein